MEKEFENENSDSDDQLVFEEERFFEEKAEESNLTANEGLSIDKYISKKVLE